MHGPGPSPLCGNHFCTEGTGQTRILLGAVSKKKRNLIGRSSCSEQEQVVTTAVESLFETVDPPPQSLHHSPIRSHDEGESDPRSRVPRRRFCPRSSSDGTHSVSGLQTAATGVIFGLVAEGNMTREDSVELSMRSGRGSLRVPREPRYVGSAGGAYIYIYIYACQYNVMILIKVSDDGCVKGRFPLFLSGGPTCSHCRATLFI